MILDHIASGFTIGLRRLERWPLDPVEGQRNAFDQLEARLRARADAGFVTSAVGFNSENGRVRWTPRKVLRVVIELQDAWRAHVEDGAPKPVPGLGHDDASDDDDQISERDLRDLQERAAKLLTLAVREPHVSAIAVSYRYYRDRLDHWPEDVVERWHAMREAFRARLLELDETELALVRAAPDGVLHTVRQNLGLAISHVREHLNQMREVEVALACE